MAISFDRTCKCGYPLTGKQRLYCSRLCNHKAAWERRSAKVKAQAAAPGLTPAEQEQYAALVADGLRVVPVPAEKLYPTMSPPSLWQRLRKRVGDVVATIKYLISSSIDEYP